MKFFRTYQSYAKVLAFLIAFASLGLRMDMHYCMGKLKSADFFGVAPSCHQVVEKPHCATMKVMDNSTDGKSCCDNAHLEIDTDDQLLKASVAFKFNQLVLIATYLISQIATIELSAVFQPYIQYRPPLFYHDIYMMIETFII